MDQEMHVGPSSKAEYALIINDNRTSLLAEMYEKSLGVDVTIVNAGKEIHGHRSILSAAIPYFTAMFSTGFREAESGEIVLNHIDPDATELIIRYVYTGQLEINWNNWQALLMAAHFLQLHQITNYCCDYFEERLNFRSLFQIKDLPIVTNFPKLIEIVDDFFSENFERLSKMSEFLDLPFDVLVNIISKDELRIHGELNIFMSLMNWIKHDLQARKPNLAQLFRKIRLWLINKEDLIKFISSEPLITEDKECNDYLDTALSYHILPEERNHPKELWTGAGHCEEETIYIFGGTHGPHPRPIIEKWKLEPFSSELQDLPVQMTDYTTALLHNKIYMIGGSREEGITSQVFALDLLTGVYSSVASMNYERKESAAAVIGGKIYVFGGDSGYGSPLKSVECFLPAENKWIMKSDMIYERSGLAAVVLNESIYAIGGYLQRSVERYDPEKNSWTIMPSMTIDRAHAGVAVYDGKIFVAGGLSGGESAQYVVRTAEVHEPYPRTWTLIRPMIDPRHHHHLVNYHCKIYAIGGKDYSAGNIKSIEELKPDSDGNTWCWNTIEQEISIFNVESIQVVKL